MSTPSSLLDTYSLSLHSSGHNDIITTEPNLKVSTPPISSFSQCTPAQQSAAMVPSSQQQQKQLIMLIEALVDQSHSRGVDDNSYGTSGSHCYSTDVLGPQSIDNPTVNTAMDDGYVLMNIQTAPHISIRVLCADHVCPGDIVSAGILCFAIPPTGEDIFFLLSKDNATRGHCWSHLGGGRYDSETVEETASREFIEESLNVVDIEPAISSLSSSSAQTTTTTTTAVAEQEILHHQQHDNPSIRKQIQLAKMLEQGDYFVKIITCVNYGAPHSSTTPPTTPPLESSPAWVASQEQTTATIESNTSAKETNNDSDDNNNTNNNISITPHVHRRRHHVTYVKQIPWQPQITAKYERVRRILAEISQRNDTIDRYRQVWQTLASKQTHLQIYDLGDTIHVPCSNSTDTGVLLPDENENNNNTTATATIPQQSVAHKTMFCSRFVIRTQSGDVIAQLSSCYNQHSALHGVGNIESIIMSNDQRPRTLLSCPFSQQPERVVSPQRPGINDSFPTITILSQTPVIAAPSSSRSSFVYTNTPVVFEWTFEEQHYSPHIPDDLLEEKIRTATTSTASLLSEHSTPVKITQLISPDDALLHAYITYLREVYSLWLYWCQLPVADRVHPAIRVDLIRRTITVANEFHEKDELRFWSRCRLETVLQQGGCFQQQPHPQQPHHHHCSSSSSNTTHKYTIPRNTRAHQYSPSEKASSPNPLPRSAALNRRNTPSHSTTAATASPKSSFNPREVFRPSFLPTLAVALNCLAQSAPTIANGSLVYV